jgi:hypothetical protein
MGDSAEILVEISVEPVLKKITENFQCIAKKNVENQGCYNRRVISITINLVHKTSLI